MADGYRDELLNRIACALEEGVRLWKRPPNEKRIRVRVVDPDPYLVELLLASPAYCIGVGATAIGGQPGLYWDPDDAISQRVINTRDIAPQHRVRVNRTALQNERLTVGEYLVTVDLQPDFSTWRWREWMAL